jgi:hypothetical protein
LVATVTLASKAIPERDVRILGVMRARKEWWGQIGRTCVALGGT